MKLTNGHLISHAAEDSTAHEEELAIPSDSLLAFNRATLSLQPLDYLFGSKITIKDFSIENPRFYGFVNKNGRANWDIYESETDSTETDAGKKPLPPIDLQKVRIYGGHFTYDDRQADLFYRNAASSYALTVHWLEEPIHSIWKWAVHPFYSVTQLIH